MSDLERVDREQKQLELERLVRTYLSPEQLKIVNQVEHVYRARRDANAPNCTGFHLQSLQEAMDIVPGAKETYDYMKRVSSGLILAPDFIELTDPPNPDDCVPG